jgi:hypothetical protein
MGKKWNNTHTKYIHINHPAFYGLLVIASFPCLDQRVGFFVSNTVRSNGIVCKSLSNPMSSIFIFNKNESFKTFDVMCFVIK